MVAIAGFTKNQILSAVREMYSEVANLPSKQFHFPTGRGACLFVGYPEDWLDRLPASAVESFAGVGFPFRADVIRPGDRVLDIAPGRAPTRSSRRGPWRRAAGSSPSI